MGWPLADELRRQTDFECSGPDCLDAAEILEVMRADLPSSTSPLGGASAMPSEVLPRDNTLLSRSTIEPSDPSGYGREPAGAATDQSYRPGNCTNLASAVEAYVEAGIAPATRRVYRADLDHWGPRAVGSRPPRPRLPIT